MDVILSDMQQNEKLSLTINAYAVNLHSLTGKSYTQYQLKNKLVCNWYKCLEALHKLDNTVESVGMYDGLDHCTEGGDFLHFGKKDDRHMTY